jgi:hypothetical protein
LNCRLASEFGHLSFDMDVKFMNLSATDGPAHNLIQTQPRTVGKQNDESEAKLRLIIRWVVRTTAYLGSGYRCGRSIGRGNTVAPYFAKLLSQNHFVRH